MTPDCLREWDKWYMAYDEDESGKRICKDKSFSSWYSRKPSMVIKIAILRAAAETNQLLMQWKYIESAIEEIRKVETTMGKVFKAIGKSEISAEVDSVFQIILEYKHISEKQLMSLVWRDIDASKFSNVIDTLQKTGTVKREFKGPSGEIGIWYKIVETGF